MRLTRIAASGLKGGDGRPVDLGAVTLVVGANASGKTRVLDAAQLVVLGRHPEWPRTADGVMAAAAGDELELSAAFETEGEDVEVRRSWQRRVQKSGKGAGTVKITTDVSRSGPSAATVETRRRMVDDLFGLPSAKQAREDVESALDVRAFRELSDDRKREALLRLSATAVALVWTRERLREALPDALRPLVDDWEKGEGPAEWVGRQAAKTKDELLKAQEKARDARSGAEELQEDAEPIDPAAVGALRQDREQAIAAKEAAAGEGATRIERACGAIETAEAAVRRAAEAGRQADGVEAELRRLREARVDDVEVTRLRRFLSDLDDGFEEGGLPQRREHAEAAERDLAAGVDANGLKALDEEMSRVLGEEPAAPDRAALEEAERALADAAQAEASVRTEIQAEREAGGQDERALAVAEDRHLRLFGAVEAIRAVEADSFDDPHCPTCNQVVGAAALGHLLELVAEASREAEGKKAAVDERRVIHAAAWSRLDEAERRTADATGSVARARVAFSGLEQDTRRRRDAEVERLRRERAAEEAQIFELDRGLKFARRTALDTLHAAERRRDDTVLALRAAESVVPDAQRIAELEGRLAELRPTAAASPPEEHLADLRDALAEVERQVAAAAEERGRHLDELKVHLVEAERRLSVREHVLAVRARAAEAEESAQEARERYATLGPRGLLGQVLRTILDPFTGDVNRFLDGLSLGRFTVRLLDERDNEVFRMGVERAGSFSPLETLSASERTVVCAGLSLSLARLGGLRWRPVLVDEVQSLDGPGYGDRRRRFLERLVEVVRRGDADQAIVVGCPDVVEAPDGVTVVHVEAPAVPVEAAA